MDKEHKIIKETAAYLNGIFDVQDIYIFGSIISGNFNEDSDIDMAIFLNDYHKYSLKDFAKILFYIQNNISSRMEIHFSPVRDDPLSFSNHIKHNGKKVA